MKDIRPPKALVYAAFSLGTLAVLFMVFSAGVAVGSRKASFNDRYWRPGDEMDPFRGVVPDLPAGGHGATGEVVSVSSSGFVVALPDESERAVRVNASTTLRRFRGDASTTDVKVGDSVIVLGSPDDDGDISASLIRIIPSDQASSTAN